jgi:DNA-directed RNA polymerase specialized sigma24 family protein
MPLPSAEITTLLKAWRGGDEQALERLTPLVYEHLRKLGRQYVRKELPAVRLDATSLVHQAYVRLVDARTVD